MKIIIYVNKMLSLIKCLRNPGLFIYSIYHYLKKDVNLCLAKIIAKFNEKDYKKTGVTDFLLETYDESNQLVHPDICFYNNKYWFVGTPYPYGMEEYENPSIYIGNTINEFFLLDNNPIATQEKHDYGYHLSDPCIASTKEELFCFYRESKRIAGCGYDSVFLLRYDNKKKNWKDKKLLYNGKGEDSVLSPAFIFDLDSNLYMYHVNTISNNIESELFLTSFDLNYKISSKRKINCFGIPRDFFLWHIGIVFEDTCNKCGHYNEKLLGLFLCRNKVDKSKFVLFLAKSEGIGTDWKIEEEVNIKSEINDIAKNIYKSCFIPNHKGIIISFKDIKNRYRMCIQY